MGKRRQGKRRQVNSELKNIGEIGKIRFSSELVLCFDTTPSNHQIDEAVKVVQKYYTNWKPHYEEARMLSKQFTRQ